MSNNSNNSKALISPVRSPSRIRASGPILILAVLFVLGAFLTWYLTWFGRDLSDADISTYLADTNHPRKIQHALLKVQERIDRKDASARQWYPQVIALASSSETEVRLTVAWLMGFDNKEAVFHDVLRKLLDDSQPIVRRNAALALVRFNDSSGRAELKSILEPYDVRAPAEGVLNSSLKPGSQVSRGALLARVIQNSNQVLEMRSPLPGIIETTDVPTDSRVTEGQVLLKLRSDEASVWEALRGLSIVGQAEDLPEVQHFAADAVPYSERIKVQAALTAKAIQRRINS